MVQDDKRSGDAMSGTITFGDLVGEVHHDPAAIAEFLQWWFRKGDLVNATFIKEGRRKKVITQGAERDDLIEMLSQADFKTEFLDKADFNAYFTTSASNKVFDGDGEHRPTKSDCKALRGVWADVDVKSGVFDSEDAVREWAGSLAVKPGAIVWTGSGGAHLYWKVKGLSGIPVEEVGKRWWSYLDTTTPEGVVIDRLIDVETRILRLPGTTRFPKPKEMISRKPVTVEFTGEGPMDVETFRELTDNGIERYHERTRETRELVEGIDSKLYSYAEEGTWSRLVLLTATEELISDFFSWDDILEDAGWELYRVGSEGRREWSRPGKIGKAGVTDWEESPEVLSLFSWSEETGLADLYEAEVTLTKWRVYLRLRHNDNVESALNELIERAKN